MSNVNISPRAPTPAPAPTYAQVKAKLEGAGMFRRDNVAREIVRGLSPAQQVTLDLRTENLLVSSMLDGYVSRADEKAVFHLYQAPTESDEFRAFHSKYLTAMIQAFKDSPEAQLDRAEWRRLSPAGRLEAVKAMVRLAGASYSQWLTEVPVETFEQAPDERGMATVGYVQGKKFFINTHPKFFMKLDIVVFVVVHEITHLFQQMLADLYRVDAIPADMGRGIPTAAESFYLNQRCYMGGLRRMPRNRDEILTYMMQPLEHNANFAGLTVCEALGLTDPGAEPGQPSDKGVFATTATPPTLRSRVREIDGELVRVSEAVLA